MRYFRVPPSTIRNAGPELTSVRYWLLEVDNQGRPLREIGMAGDGEPIRVAPMGKHRGIWCDSPVLLTGPEWEELPHSTFEEAWRRAVASSKVHAK